MWYSVAQGCVKRCTFLRPAGVKLLAAVGWDATRIPCTTSVPAKWNKNLRGVVMNFRIWCCQLSGIVKSGSRQLWKAKFPLLGIFRAFRDENLLESQTLCSLLTLSLWLKNGRYGVGLWVLEKGRERKHTYLYYQELYNIICTFTMKWTWCSSMCIDITYSISIKAHGVL